MAYAGLALIRPAPQTYANATKQPSETNQNRSGDFNVKKAMSKPALAALALLFSSTGFAAAINVVTTENSFLTNDGLVNVGDSFFLDVFGSDFPDTVGATLTLTFNSAAVRLASPLTRLAPLVTDGLTSTGIGSVFAGGVQTPLCVPQPSTANPICSNPFPSGGNFSILAGLTGALPTGNFGGAAAFRLNFVAIGLGAANVQIGDDGADFTWSDALSLPIEGVTYTYQNNNIQVIPVPAAVWLFGSALGLLGVARRRLA